jgi:hypothetical protein
MKIYINNLNLDMINYISDLFRDKLNYSENYINVFTDEDIYIINDKDIFILNSIDKDIVTYDKYYNDFTLIVDPSFLNKVKTSSINGETHLSFQIRKEIYKMNKHSNIEMIIEYYFKNNKFIPNDIYFEIDKDIDINEFLIKKEIIEFLSVLN